MMDGVRVLLFASAREAAGCGELNVPCGADGLSSDELWRELTVRCEALGALRGVVRIARNSEYLADGGRIAAGDEIAVIPQVSGG